MLKERAEDAASLDRKLNTLNLNGVSSFHVEEHKEQMWSRWRRRHKRRLFCGFQGESADQVCVNSWLQTFFIGVRIALHRFQVQPGRGVVRVLVGCVLTHRLSSLQLLSDKPHARHYRSVNESWHGQTKSCAYFKIWALLNSSCQLGGDLISKWNIRQRWHTGGLGRVLPVCMLLLICVQWLAGSRACAIFLSDGQNCISCTPPTPWVLVPWMLLFFNTTLNESSDRSEGKGNCS